MKKIDQKFMNERWNKVEAHVGIGLWKQAGFSHANSIVMLADLFGIP